MPTFFYPIAKFLITHHCPQKKDLPTSVYRTYLQNYSDLPPKIRSTYLLFLQQVGGRNKPSLGWCQTRALKK